MMILTLFDGAAAHTIPRPFDEGSQVVHCITNINDIGSMELLRRSSISLLDGSTRITREELLWGQIGHKIPAIGWSSCTTLLSPLLWSSLPTRHKSVKFGCLWGEWGPCFYSHQYSACQYMHQAYDMINYIQHAVSNQLDQQDDITACV